MSRSTPDLRAPVDGRAKRAPPKFNIKQYKGVVGTVATIKENIEAERARNLAKQRELADHLKVTEDEATLVQKELSVQLRCAGRSYQQILGANSELREQLRAEEERRASEIEILERQVGELKGQLADAAKPWKVEIGKRDLKIMKLQEAATDQERRLRSTLDDLATQREQFQKEIVAREETKESVLREIEFLRENMAAEADLNAAAIGAEKERSLKEATALRVQIQEKENAVEETKALFERRVKELELKNKGLQKQLDAVDYTSYERKIEHKEAGYDKLIKDFRIKQDINNENMERVRVGYEEVFKKLDLQLQDKDNECERKMVPWVELVQKREAEIERLHAKVAEVTKAELEGRERAAATEKELSEQLSAAQEGLLLANQENYKLQTELKNIIAEAEDETSFKRKIHVMKMKLDEVTKQCEDMIENKDRELKEKTDLVTKLQTRVHEETLARSEADREWDRRVQAKEEGYQKVVADLAFAEGQIAEERGRTLFALHNVKKRERSIERQRMEHQEELRIRMKDRNMLTDQIDQLESQCESQALSTEQLRQQWEAKFEAHRIRADEREDDLFMELGKRDRERAEVDDQLSSLRLQFEKARLSWEEKERELEVIVRGRDRTVTGLKNEIEFMNDSWDIKYNRLMGLFEKLQKKYDEQQGPNGAAEAWRRARDLKALNEKQYGEILELREGIKKQKRQIRDLQLDIDAVMKETADIVAEKEKGMALMAGEVAKFQAQVRHEVQLRETLIKETAAEKVSIAESFQDRIAQLDQLVESLRFTDRQNLLDTIDVWKRAYERVCVERDELDDHYRGLLDTKEMQLNNMVQEVFEEKAKVQAERDRAQVLLDELDQKWKVKEAQWKLDLDHIKKLHAAVSQERDLAKMEVSRSLNLVDATRQDPEKENLKQRVAVLEEQLAATEAGFSKFVEDNTALHNENNELREKLEHANDEFIPQIRWRDERYEVMVKEHEALKQVLELEMKKAQDNCKLIEAEVRKFPNPFEEELQELRDKYAQTQAGMVKMNMANVHLREEMRDLAEAKNAEIEHLEENLKLASHLLKEILSLGALQSLAQTEEVRKVEAALGLDLNGDRRIG